MSKNFPDQPYTRLEILKHNWPFVVLMIFMMGLAVFSGWRLWTLA